MSQILIIEDNHRLGPTLEKGLNEQGYRAMLARNGNEALETLKNSCPNLVLLDLGLPDCDGVNLLGTIREQGFERPVLILTARDRLIDKVSGLDAGADDYLIKPFAFAELLARVRALLRRDADGGTTLRAGDITINLFTRQVINGDQTIDLTPREFDLLTFLARHFGQIVSREMLAEHVWRETSRFSTLDNVIDVHVSRLRKKLRSDSQSCDLQVIRGVGITLKSTS